MKKMTRKINSILKLFKLRITRIPDSGNGFNYISAKKTVHSAKSKGLSVCDYVEQEWDQIGETQKVIDKMKDFGIFKNNNLKICEIGAGTGRYMEKVLEECKPASYESYETSEDWAKWLLKQYPIISHHSDGCSLLETKNNSIDLIHAHGVFVYIPFFDTARYFKEIDRVAKSGASIIFDCITEECLQNELLDSWVNSEYSYPRPIYESFIYRYFPQDRYELLGTFFIKYGMGKSKYFVFRKLV
jgi:ubiquinone/menaquinone biosynthesis C-methylase UbiE